MAGQKITTGGRNPGLYRNEFWKLFQENFGLSSASSKSWKNKWCKKTICDLNHPFVIMLFFLFVGFKHWLKIAGSVAPSYTSLLRAKPLAAMTTRASSWTLAPTSICSPFNLSRFGSIVTCLDTSVFFSVFRCFICFGSNPAPFMACFKCGRFLDCFECVSKLDECPIFRTHQIFQENQKCYKNTCKFSRRGKMY